MVWKKFFNIKIKNMVFFSSIFFFCISITILIPQEVKAFDFSLRLIRSGNYAFVSSKDYINAIGDSNLTNQEIFNIEFFIQSLSSISFQDCFPELYSDLFDIFSSELVPQRLFQGLFENKEIILRGAEYSGKSARIRFNIVDSDNTGFVRQNERPVYSFLTYEEKDGILDISLNMTRGFIEDASSNPHILLQLIIHSFSHNVMDLTDVESELMLSQYNSELSSHRIVSDLVRFMLDDAVKDSDIDYLKTILSYDFRLSKETTDILADKGRSDLIQIVPKLSEELNYLAKNRIRKIEVGFDFAVEKASTEVINLIKETPPEQWEEVIGPIINRVMFGFDGRVKRGLAGDEARTMMAINREEATNLGLKTNPNIENVVGFGYAHALKHRDEIEQYGHNFDVVLYSTINNPDHIMQNTRADSSRNLFFSHYLRDPQGTGNIWAVGIIRPEDNQLVTLFTATSDFCTELLQGEAECKKCISKTFEIMVARGDLNMYITQHDDGSVKDIYIPLIQYPDNNNGRGENFVLRYEKNYDTNIGNILQLSVVSLNNEQLENIKNSRRLVSKENNDSRTFIERVFKGVRTDAVQILRNFSEFSMQGPINQEEIDEWWKNVFEYFNIERKEIILGKVIDNFNIHVIVSNPTPNFNGVPA